MYVGVAIALFGEQLAESSSYLMMMQDDRFRHGNRAELAGALYRPERSFNTNVPEAASYSDSDTSDTDTDSDDIDDDGGALLASHLAIDSTIATAPATNNGTSLDGVFNAIMGMNSLHQRAHGPFDCEESRATTRRRAPRVPV